MKVSGVHLQFWSDTPTGEVDGDNLWILLDGAEEAVSHEAHLGGVGPDRHLLQGAASVNMCY